MVRGGIGLFTHTSTGGWNTHMPPTNSKYSSCPITEGGIILPVIGVTGPAGKSLKVKRYSIWWFRFVSGVGRMPLRSIVVEKANPSAVVVPLTWKSPKIGSTRYLPTCVKKGIVCGSGQTQKQKSRQISEHSQ